MPRVLRCISARVGGAAQLAWGPPQVWLQQFAWTEAEKPGRLADRCEHRRTPGAAASLAEEPMFCMETALKALYWATLVYRYDESAPDLRRDKPLRVGRSCSAPSTERAMRLSEHSCPMHHP